MSEFEILRLGHHGDGIAMGPVYAARTLPGERVTGDRVDDRLENVRIVTPSEDRVRPGCRHYRGCGGCDLQHASDTFVSRWKQDFVAAALAEKGLTPSFRPLSTSPPQSRRRATFAARRTKSGALAGFHARRSDVITAVSDCRVLSPRLTGFLPAAEALAIAGASRKTPLSVSVTVSDEGPDVCVQQGKSLNGTLRQTLAQIVQSHAIARLSWNDETVVVAAQPVQEFDGIRVIPPPGAFLQATLHGQDTLVSGVRDIVAGAARIVDLYSGCGTFALPLTRKAQVHAVEGDAGLLDAAMAGWRMAGGLRRFTMEKRDLFRDPVPASDLQGFDAAVIDPPRAGAAARISELAAAKRPVIAYVSCNPVTFARDAAMLCEAGYTLDWVQVIDQFRWSMHTELVSCFRMDKI